MDWEFTRQGGLARWQALCDGDAALRRFLPGAGAGFALVQPGHSVALELTDGALTLRHGDAPNRFTADAAAWARFLQPMPPRHHHNLFAMRMRAAGFAYEGDELAWMQHAHILRRALELARWAANEAGAAPASPRPSLGGAAFRPAGQGRYVTLANGVTLFAEQHGAGRPILCLHTAGADARQFHRLAAEPALAGHALVAFDMPGHGRSPPIAAPGAWALDTDLYAELVLGFRDAWGFSEDPILLGASMSGEICLEIALRAPGRFAHIVACEACEHIPARRTAWPLHPRVNGMLFTPEWVDGLMAPQSPAECAAEVWWHYSQGGYGTFPGDILFYSGGWDARGRLGAIDTSRCPLTLMTGEYDYSCTAEASEATAAQIPGARFIRMDGLGHFPFAENPALFAPLFMAALRG